MVMHKASAAVPLGHPHSVRRPGRGTLHAKRSHRLEFHDQAAARQNRKDVLSGVADETILAQAVAAHCRRGNQKKTDQGRP